MSVVIVIKVNYFFLLQLVTVTHPDHTVAFVTLTPENADVDMELGEGNAICARLDITDSLTANVRKR